MARRNKVRAGMAHPQSLVMELKGGVISTQMENSLVRVSSQRDDEGRLSWLCLPKGVESPEIPFNALLQPQRGKETASVHRALQQQPPRRGLRSLIHWDSFNPIYNPLQFLALSQMCSSPNPFCILRNHGDKGLHIPDPGHPLLHWVGAVPSDVCSAAELVHV